MNFSGTATITINMSASWFDNYPPCKFPVNLLKGWLQESIRQENYERAAKIRDEILQRDLNTTSTQM
jgi:predicted transposase YbfD/YdcC